MIIIGRDDKKNSIQYSSFLQIILLYLLNAIYKTLFVIYIKYFILFTIKLFYSYI